MSKKKKLDSILNNKKFIKFQRKEKLKQINGKYSR